MQLNIGDMAPNATLLDQNGTEVTLADMWTSGPTLFTLLRHYGCVFCREWVAVLGKNHAALIEAGFGQIVGLGIGQPKHAQRVCGRRAPAMLCLANESTTTHESYGLERGTAATMLSPKTVLAGTKATLAGHLALEAPTGDPWMMPGTFVVDRQGVIQYAFYSQNPGDHPALTDLMRVAQPLKSVQLAE